MICPKCGQQQADSADFCTSCGQPLKGRAAQPGVSGSPSKQIPNYLVQAILVTIFCCLPFGIPAIVFAAQVNGKIAAGDYAGAVESSNKAKTWCWISFGVGLAAGIIYMLILIIGGLNS